MPLMLSAFSAPSRVSFSCSVMLFTFSARALRSSNASRRMSLKNLSRKVTSLMTEEMRVACSAGLI